MSEQRRRTKPNCEAVQCYVFCSFSSLAAARISLTRPPFVSFSLLGEILDSFYSGFVHVYFDANGMRLYFFRFCFQDEFHYALRLTSTQKAKSSVSEFTLRILVGRCRKPVQRQGVSMLTLVNVNLIREKYWGGN